jgi:DNA-binding MarR family transcriptional regulator
MEARGLIERVPSPGRAIRMRLTEKGIRLRSEGGTIVEKVLAESFSPLSRAQLTALDDALASLGMH